MPFQLSIDYSPPKAIQTIHKNSKTPDNQYVQSVPLKCLHGPHPIPANISKLNAIQLSYTNGDTVQHVPMEATGPSLGEFNVLHKWNQHCHNICTGIYLKPHWAEPNKSLAGYLSLITDPVIY